jgi:hypothetical protein
MEKHFARKEEFLKMSLPEAKRAIPIGIPRIRAL